MTGRVTRTGTYLTETGVESGTTSYTTANLGDVLAAAGPDAIMAALRNLDGDVWDEIGHRIAMLNAYEYEGGTEAWNDLNPADRATTIPPATGLDEHDV